MMLNTMVAAPCLSNFHIVGEKLKHISLNQYQNNNLYKSFKSLIVASISVICWFTGKEKLVYVIIWSSLAWLCYLVGKIWYLDRKELHIQSALIHHLKQHQHILTNHNTELEDQNVALASTICYNAQHNMVCNMIESLKCSQNQLENLLQKLNITNNVKDLKSTTEILNKMYGDNFVTVSDHSSDQYLQDCTRSRSNKIKIISLVTQAFAHASKMMGTKTEVCIHKDHICMRFINKYVSFEEISNVVMGRKNYFELLARLKTAPPALIILSCLRMILTNKFDITQTKNGQINVFIHCQNSQNKQSYDQFTEQNLNIKDRIKSEPILAPTQTQNQNVNLTFTNTARETNEINSYQKRILIVDDVETIRKLMVNYFTKLNCQVDTACNGLEACIKNQNNKYDAIFMDIDMPIMSGNQAIHVLRQQEKVDCRNAIPIYAVTGYDFATNSCKIDSSSFLQFTDILYKPVNFKKLAQLL